MIIRTAEGWKRLSDVAETNYGGCRADLTDQALEIYPFQAADIDECRDVNELAREGVISLVNPIPLERVYIRKPYPLLRFIQGSVSRHGVGIVPRGDFFCIEHRERVGWVACDNVHRHCAEYV